MPSCATRRLARSFAALVAVAGVCGAGDANAFVSPRWRAHQENLRGTMLGSWQSAGGRKHGIATSDVTMRIDIDADTFRISELGIGVSVVTKWRYLAQEGAMITIAVEDEKGKRHDIDVLVETPDALTLYVQDDEGEDEEVLRLERVP